MHILPQLKKQNEVDFYVLIGKDLKDIMWGLKCKDLNMQLWVQMHRK